jgi:RNA polymerase sigma-70 factor (ECF subfamily)
MVGPTRRDEFARVETGGGVRAKNARMLRSGIDRAFARYVRTGDPGALARVFDGSAQQLYRLAWHLLGDRHAAEDAVQQTFVFVIRQARGFDTTRRVLPWLCGILTNHALHVRRQARRRAAAIAAVGDAVVDPIAEACARETHALVAQRVRGLAEPYRQVLLLHLVHDRAPKEIAAALARPDATVRTQLARGLELLRRALPVGVGGLGAGQVPPPTGLASVREVVLTHAGAAGVAEPAAASAHTIAFSGLGVVVMKKVLSGAALAAALWCAWPLWSGNPAMPDAAERPTDATPAAAIQAVPPVLEAAAGPQAATAQRVAVVPAVDAFSATLEVLVQWADRTPAADVAVRCRPRPLDVETWLRVARTDGDGIARFERVSPGAANAMADRGATVDVELAAGSAHRVTITLPPGTDVRGRVVDLDGRPFPGATVWMSVARLSDDSEAVAVTGPDGTFTVRGAGCEHQLTATAPGFATAKEAVIRRSELVLTMRPAPGTIAGTVVDRSGRPVAGARVLVGMAMPARSGQGVHQRLYGEVIGQDVWPSRFTRTDADGRFRVEALPEWKWPMWIGAAGYAAHFEDVTVAAGGETHVQVQLTTGGSFRGRVVDDAGQPIVGAHVAAEAQLVAPDRRVSLGINPNVAPLWAQTRAATGPDGRYEIALVMPGRYVLTAQHQQRSIDGPVEVREGASTVWDAVLGPLQGNAMYGVLVDDAGAALETWTVRVEDRARPSEAWRAHVRAGGAFRTKPVSDGRHRVFARPRDPMIGDEVELGEFDPASCPLRLVVPRDRMPTARVRGRIVVQAAAKAPRYVCVTDGRQTVRVACDDDGRWEAGPLRGGSYRLRVESAAFGMLGMRGVDVVDGRDTDAGVFEVPVPGTLLVTIVDASGRRRPDAWVSARAIGGGAERAAPFHCFEHQDGVVRGNLPPGRWVLTTVDATPLASMPVDVRSGATTEVRFVVPDGVPFRVHVPQGIRGRGTLRAEWARDGVPVRDHPVWPSAAGEHLDFRAAPGTYTVEVADASGACAVATFELRAAGETFELPLPPAPSSAAPTVPPLRGLR